MATLSRDQLRHEVINLSKTMKLLERLVDEEDWTKHTTSDRNNKWLKAQTVLAGVKHCRSVLHKITPSDYDLGLGDRRSTSGYEFHDESRQLLDRLERAMIEANQELKPRPRRLSPILPTLPRPKSYQKPSEMELIESPAPNVDDTLMPADEPEKRGQLVIPTSSLLLESSSPSGPIPNTLPIPPRNPATTLIPPSLPSSTALTDSRSPDSTPGFLQTSSALQDDLAGQLAQMARQLKLNSQHFSESLAKDQGTMKDAEEKIERNYDVLTRERVRLRDHRGKSSSTTCLVFMSILVVIIGFMLTFFIIRIT